MINFKMIHNIAIEKGEGFVVARSLQSLIAGKGKTKELALESLKRAMKEVHAEGNIINYGDKFISRFGEGKEIINIDL